MAWRAKNYLTLKHGPNFLIHSRWLLKVISVRSSHNHQCLTKWLFCKLLKKSALEDLPKESKTQQLIPYITKRTSQLQMIQKSPRSLCHTSVSTALRRKWSKSLTPIISKLLRMNLHLLPLWEFLVILIKYLVKESLLSMSYRLMRKKTRMLFLKKLKALWMSYLISNRSQEIENSKILNNRLCKKNKLSLRLKLLLKKLQPKKPLEAKLSLTKKKRKRRNKKLKIMFQRSNLKMPWRQ